MVSALPVCPDQDAALRACSNGFGGELFRFGAICRGSDKTTHPPVETVLSRVARTDHALGQIRFWQIRT